MHVFPGMVPRRVGHHLPVLRVPGQQQPDLPVQEPLRRNVFLLFRLPEGMILRQCQNPEGLHRPVWGPLRVISFRRAQIRISVSHGQRAAPVENRPAQPEPQVVQQQMLHLSRAHVFALQPGEGRRGPEGALAEAIGQAASVWQAPSLPVKPAGKPGRNHGRPFPDPAAALRILPFHDRRIQQAVEMESPQGVIIPLGRIVKIPAVRCIMALHQVHVFPHPLLIHRQSVLQESDVHQDAEKAPVILRHIVQVNLVQPAVQILTLLPAQRFQEIFRSKAQSAPDDCHLHHPLIAVPDFSPVFRMLRIRPVDQALLP